MLKIADVNTSVHVYMLNWTCEKTGTLVLIQTHNAHVCKAHTHQHMHAYMHTHVYIPTLTVLYCEDSLTWKNMMD